MKRITKVSIIYMVAAMLFAQPVAQGITFNEIATMVKGSGEVIKPYFTMQNCINGALVGALFAFVGYALWKLKDDSKNPSSLDTVYSATGWYQQGSRLEKINKDHITVVVNRIYKNRVAIKKSDKKLIGQLIKCKERHAQGIQALETLLTQFQAAITQYCEEADQHAEIRITNAYNELNKYLKNN